MKSLPPTSYDEWLSLPEAEQERIKRYVWDAYERERIDIPYMALARFIATTDRTVLRGEIGTYHCGEYLLHVYVPKSEISLCDQSIRFEGFRVFWFEVPNVDEGECWDFDLETVPLDVLGIELTLNARRRDHQPVVDVFDSRGVPLVVSEVSNYEKGFRFDLCGLHPDVDATHMLVPTAAGGWRHEYAVRRQLR